MSALATRRLDDRDRCVFEAFLRLHVESSIFLLANAAKAGLVYRGEARQGVYVGAFDGSELVGVACHAWQGNLLLQAPEHTGVIARACLRESKRPLAGLIGPWPQVCSARDALGVAQASTKISGRELLYALDLDDLVVPEPITSGELSVRRPRPHEQGLLAEWRADYMVEALGYPDNAATRAEAATDMAGVFAHGEPLDLFVLLEEGHVVATSAFNARLPKVVQIGGVWTPVADRGRGLGRAVVAGQLLLARAEGVRRSVLFTEENNTSARRAYEALGYRNVGDYGLTLFAAPIDVL
jgi:ribosomal protein S18 acetylase RimI-like enzyme